MSRAVSAVLAVAGAFAAALGLLAPDARADQPSSPPKVAVPVSGIRFEANAGRTDPSVDFLARGAGYNLFLSSCEAVMTLRPASQGANEAATVETDPVTRRRYIRQPGAPARWPMGPGHSPQQTAMPVLRMQLAGANRRAHVSGEVPSPVRTNYFVGNDPSKWRIGSTAYQRVRYREVYPGVDLVYYGSDRQLEYDFVVAPGASPRKIALGFEGSDGARIDARGDLLLKTAGSEVRWKRPVAYQVKSGRRVAVEAAYVVGANNSEKSVYAGRSSLAPSYSPLVREGRANNSGRGLAASNRRSSPSYSPLRIGRNHSQRVSFELASYDHSLPLVIDPVLQYSTFLGGNSEDYVFSAHCDLAGYLYVVGTTYSPDFPQKNASRVFNTAPDLFVAKYDLNQSGAASLLYSTVLGGTGNDQIYDATIDEAGQVYLTGFTPSTNFPTFHAVHTTLGGVYDGFLTRIDTTLTGAASLAYSTYLGGSANDVTTGVSTDGTNSGVVYVLGRSDSTDYPVTASAYQGSLKGDFDAVVTKLNTKASGSASLLYSTYFGGGSEEFIDDIVADPSGRVDFVGGTYSADFPTRNAYQSFYNNITPDLLYSDAYLVRLDTSKAGLASLLYSTYLGGTHGEVAYFVRRDAAGYVYVGGITDSLDYPVAGGFQAGNGVSVDFVTKFDVTLAGSGSLLYSTALGGSGNGFQSPYFMAVDPGGDVYIAGLSSTDDWPTKNALQGARAGSTDLVITRIDPTQTVDDSLVYSTYLGGSGFEQTGGYAYDGAGSLYVGAYTSTGDFPVRNSMQGPAGVEDGFLAKVDTNRAGADSLAFSTYLGGSGTDAAYSLALDPAGFVVVAGYTGSADFPILNGAQTLYGGGAYDSFVTRLWVPSLLTSITFDTDPAAGGAAFNGYVTLDKPTIDDLTVSLSSDSTDAVVLDSVVIPAGQSSVSFPIWTASVPETRFAQITAYANESYAYSTLTIEPALTSLTLSPDVAAVCQEVTGTVTINGPADRDLEIALFSGNNGASVPPSVTILMGDTSASFTVTPAEVGTTQTGDIYAQYGGVFVSAPLIVQPIAPAAVGFSPYILLGGGHSTGTVTLNCPASPGDIEVTLVSANPSLASVPASVIVPFGQTTATFDVATAPVTTDVPVQVSATVSDVTAVGTITVGAPRKLMSVKLSPTSVAGGKPSTGSIVLNFPAFPGGFTANLTSSNAVATVPATATAPEGSKTGTFIVNTIPVAVNTTSSISAKAGGITKSATLTVKPAVLMSIAIKPNSVVGGKTTTATITMTGVCKNNTTVNLSSANTAVATVPASVTVLAGQSTATVTVTSKPQTVKTTVVITATQGGVTKTATLTVIPPALSSIALSPNPVKGGLSTTGTVKLTGTAKVNTVVKLTNANAKALLPNGTNSDTVTVAAGASSATFVMTTKATAVTTKGTVSAILGTITKSVTLTVSP